MLNLFERNSNNSVEQVKQTQNRPQVHFGHSPRGLALTRYCVTSKLYCGSPSSFYWPPPLAKPTLLQYFCTPISQYTLPHRAPFCMPYTIHDWRWQYRVKAKSRPTYENPSTDSYGVDCEISRKEITGYPSGQRCRVRLSDSSLELAHNPSINPRSSQSHTRARETIF